MADYLLDTSILVRFYDPASADHHAAGRAVADLRRAGHQLSIAAQNLVEFWSVTTRPTDVNGLGWNPARAHQEILQLRSWFPMLEDAPAVLGEWLRLVVAHQVRGKRVHDTRLVALMNVYGVSHLLTLNSDDFRSFTGIRVVHPNKV